EDAKEKLLAKEQLKVDSIQAEPTGFSSPGQTEQRGRGQRTGRYPPPRCPAEDLTQHFLQQRHRLSWGCRSQGGQGGTGAWAGFLTWLRGPGQRCVLSPECGEAGYHPSRTPDPCSQSPFPQGQASCVAVPLSGPGRRAGGGGDKTCPAGLPVFSVAPGSPDGSQLTYHLPASSTFSDPSPREELPEGQDGNTKEGHSGRGKGRRAPPGFCEAGDLEGDTGQRAEHPGERATATPADPGQEDGRPAGVSHGPSPLTTKLPRFLSQPGFATSPGGDTEKTGPGLHRLPAGAQQARPGNSWSCGRLESFPKKEFRLVNVSTVAADGKDLPPLTRRGWGLGRPSGPKNLYVIQLCGSQKRKLPAWTTLPGVLFLDGEQPLPWAPASELGYPPQR
ncbi:hypothetical protein EI555_003535, partial [Monodon monoceros]